MNAYEYALKLEKDGEKYYRELADKSPYPGLKTVFNILAEEEVKHCHVIEEMMKDSNVDAEKLDIVLDTKTIYETLLSEKDNVNFNNDEVKFYEEAIAREDGAEKFYVKKAQELDTENEKQIFLKLAAEEKKHVDVLQNILDFIQEPQKLVAAAEF